MKGLTKKELIAALEPVPDDEEILVGTNVGLFSVKYIQEYASDSEFILIVDDGKNKSPLNLKNENLGEVAAFQ